jgi:hypothetical protein
VTVTLESPDQGATLIVADDGPRIPEEALGALLSTRLDPSSIGRPSTIALFWAQTLAQQLGTQIELARAERGCRIEVKFPAG